MKIVVFKISFIIFILFLFIECNNGGSNSLSVNKESSKDSLEKIHKDITTKSSSEYNTSKENTTQNNSSVQQNNTITVKQNSSKSDFIILSATSQKWTGGARGSGGGVRYEICIISNHSSSELIIDKLWIGQASHTVQVSKNYPFLATDGFSANDTVYIKASDYHKDPNLDKNNQVNGDRQQSSTEKSNTNPPYAYKGEALIGYTVSGKRLYKEISTLVVNPPLNYP